MGIIDYFKSERKEHWLDKIKKSDWGAGGFLHDLIESGSFYDALGKRSTVLLLTEGDDLISFCTYAEKDDVQPTDLTPWMGFVYTFPAYRGHNYSGVLMDEVIRRAKEDGFEKIYISTTHTGMYEKYGCEFMAVMADVNGDPTRLYTKKLNKM